MAAEFEIKHRSGEFRFHLEAGNGEIIAKPGLRTKASAENGIVSVKRNAADAAIVDLSEK